MVKRWLPAGILGALLVLTLPVFSQNGPPPDQAQGAAHAHRALPKPTNLKVLPADTSPEELRKIMRGYAAALGVKCGFCHAANPQTHRLDFASDAKEDKGMARIMIAMTQTINQQYMTQIHDPDAMPEDKHVTCGTCHRGHTMPEHFMPPAQPHPGPPPGAPPQ
jgi:Photosynthetic reaction centre cytochrome C subunit